MYGVIIVLKFFNSEQLIFERFDSICCFRAVSMSSDGSVWVSASVVMFSHWVLSPSFTKFSESYSSSSVSVSSKIIRLVPAILSRRVGGLRFRGEVRVHANTEGIASVRSSLLPARIFLKSFSLKCLEQTFVVSFI